jgi:uncharacterized membrane protein YhiD involved in acid resistance
VIERVMAAISFLGAGALIRGAADIRLCCTIGLAYGAGDYDVAVTFAFTFVILTGPVSSSAASAALRRRDDAGDGQARSRTFPPPSCLAQCAQQ